jgi:hypothetical protein
MKGPALLSLPGRIAEIRQEETVLIIEVFSEQTRGQCPSACEESDSVHRRYIRRIKGTRLRLCGTVVELREQERMSIHISSLQTNMALWYLHMR